MTHSSVMRRNTEDGQTDGQMNHETLSEANAGSSGIHHHI